MLGLMVHNVSDEEADHEVMERSMRIILADLTPTALIESHGLDVKLRL